MSAETVNVATAAKMIHKAPQDVRWGLQQQRLPFGSAVQKPDGKWSYNIIKSRVQEYANLLKKGEKTNE